MSRTGTVRGGRRGRIVVGLVAATAALAVATACSSSKPKTASSGGTSSAGGDTVEVKNFSFTPADLTVAVGTKVTWKFEDSTPHNVKADDGTFGSPSSLNSGKSYDFTFTKAGSYTYICTIHPSMKGTVTAK